MSHSVLLPSKSKMASQMLELHDNKRIFLCFYKKPYI
jgi:hypothetical protein